LSQESPTEYYFEFKAADKIRQDMLQEITEPCSIKNHPEAHYQSKKVTLTNFPGAINDSLIGANVEIDGISAIEGI
ncbi:14088_t:CDS:2, partial [Racocetra persica]